MGFDHVKIGMFVPFVIIVIVGLLCWLLGNLLDRKYPVINIRTILFGALLLFLGYVFNFIILWSVIIGASIAGVSEQVNNWISKYFISVNIFLIMLYNILIGLLMNYPNILNKLRNLRAPENIFRAYGKDGQNVFLSRNFKDKDGNPIAFPSGTFLFTGKVWVHAFAACFVGNILYAFLVLCARWYSQGKRHVAIDWSWGSIVVVIVISLLVSSLGILGAFLRVPKSDHKA